MFFDYLRIMAGFVLLFYYRLTARLKTALQIMSIGERLKLPNLYFVTFKREPKKYILILFWQRESIIFQTRTRREPSSERDFSQFWYIKEVKVYFIVLAPSPEKLHFLKLHAKCIFEHFGSLYNLENPFDLVICCHIVKW